MKPLVLRSKHNIFGFWTTVTQQRWDVTLLTFALQLQFVIVFFPSLGVSTQRPFLEGPVSSASVRCFCGIVSSTPLVTAQRVTKCRVCVRVSKGLSKRVCVCVSVKRVGGGLWGGLIPTTSEANRASDVTQWALVMVTSQNLQLPGYRSL